MKKRLLLIDDDPLVLKSLMNLLQSKGYEVFGYKSGIEAFKAFEGEKFDLIISDIRMSDQDGIETVKKIRQLEKEQGLAPIPIVMITGYASEDAPVQAIKLGVQDYFLKPLDTDELLKSIESFLQKEEKPVRFSILGIGIVSPLGFTKQSFWQSINQCQPFYRPISDSIYPELKDFYCMKIENLKPEDYFDEKQLHNLDRNSIFISLASKFAIQDSGLKISKIGSDDIGVSIGTSISIGTSMSDFDESVLREGYRRSRIGIFPNAVMCAPASRVSIFEHITGSNTTISSGMNSGIDAVGHACFCLEETLSKIMVAGGSDALSDKVLLGYAKEGLLFRQLNGPMKNKRGAFIPSEGASVLVLGKVDETHPDPHVYGEILSYACGFSPFNQRDVTLRGETLATVLEDCLNRARLSFDDIDCVLLSSYFNEFDYQTELVSLEKLSQDLLHQKIILRPKKFLGESFAAYAPQLIVLGVGLLTNQISSQAVEYLSEMNSTSRPKRDKINCILIVHVDSGGHQSALVLKGK